MARLSKMKREQIRQRLQAGETLAVIARTEGVGYQTVWRIKHDVSRASSEPRKTYRILTPKERLEIKAGRAMGWTLAKIAKRYDDAESTISRVISEQTGVHAGAVSVGHARSGIDEQKPDTRKHKLKRSTEELLIELFKRERRSLKASEALELLQCKKWAGRGAPSLSAVKDSLRQNSLTFTMIGREEFALKSWSISNQGER